MNTYNNYIDYLIKNYPLQSESSDTESNILIGGKNDNIKNKNNDYPSGGFPPIILCDTKQMKEDIIEEEEKTKRGYTTHKSTVSIKDIMEKRRTVTPFINLANIK